MRGIVLSKKRGNGESFFRGLDFIQKISDQPVNTNRSRKFKRISAGVLTALILMSVVFIVVTLPGNVSAENASLSILGPSKMNVGQTSEYTGSISINNVAQEPSKFVWRWSIPSTSNWKLSSTLNTASLTCVRATTDPINLELEVFDSRGNLLIHSWKTILDPYTEAMETIDTTPIGAVAEADGTGWFQWSYNMAVKNSGINPAEIILDGLIKCKSLIVRNGTWNANLGTLPENVTLNIDTGALGITYTASNGDYIVDKCSGKYYWNGVDDTNLLTHPPSGEQSYSYLIGRFTDGTYYAVNGTTNQYITAWQSSSTVDASTTIQKAISAIKASGKTGIIEFNAGNYYVNNVNITGGVTLRGAGLLSSSMVSPTTLIQNGEKSVLVFNQDTSNFGFTIENIALNGDSAKYDTGSGIYVNPTSSGTFDDVLIDHVNFMGFPEYGIYTSRSWGWIIDNSILEYNSVSNNSCYAAYIGRSGGQAIIKSNKIMENYGGGLYTSASGAAITENRIAQNIGVNVYLDEQHMIFSSNVVYNSGDAGVIAKGSESTISNNNIFKNSGSGLNVTGEASIIQGNIFYENGDSQIYVRGANCVVSSNTIRDGKGPGLFFDGCLGTVATGNYFYRNGDASQGQITVYAENCTITSNTFNGGGVTGYGINLAWGKGNLIAENNFYSHQADSVKLYANYPVTLRSNSGITFTQGASTPLFRIDGVGYIFAQGKDPIVGTGNATTTWQTGETYTVNAFDVNIYISGGESSTTVLVNGNIISDKELSVLTIAAPVGTKITITNTQSMPSITIVPV